MRTFDKVQTSAEGYALSWGNKLDLTSKEIYEGSQAIDISETEQSRIVSQVADARKDKGLSQVQLQDITGVRQPVIARMETGASSPRLDTLIKVLAPLGKTLQVVDLATAR